MKSKKKYNVLVEVSCTKSYLPLIEASSPQEAAALAKKQVDALIGDSLPWHSEVRLVQESKEETP